MILSANIENRYGTEIERLKRELQALKEQKPLPIEEDTTPPRPTDEPKKSEDDVVEAPPAADKIEKPSAAAPVVPASNNEEIEKLRAEIAALVR